MAARWHRVVVQGTCGGKPRCRAAERPSYGGSHAGCHSCPSPTTRVVVEAGSMIDGVADGAWGLQVLG